MGRLKKIIPWFMLILLAGRRELEAKDPEVLLSKLKIEFSSTLDFYSKYVWRGFTLDSDPVIQLGLSLSGYDFTFSWWSSRDYDNNDGLDSDG